MTGDAGGIFLTVQPEAELLRIFVLLAGLR